MKFVYQPEGAEPRKWTFAPEKLMSPEAEAVERVTRMTFAEWSLAVGRGSMTALHALLWVMLKREEPTLSYDAVEFCLDDVTFEMSDEESDEALADLDKRIADGEVLSAEEKAAHAALKADVAKRGTGGDDPKASPADQLPAS